MSKRSDGDSVLDALQRDDENSSIQYLVAVLVGVLTLAFIYLWVQRRQRRGRIVAIAGISESGKTTLFARIVSDQSKAAPIETFTSATRNEADVLLSSGQSLRLVDVPGNERVRHKDFEAIVSSLVAIVFVVDSASFSKKIRDVAEFLNALLTDQRVKVPIAIACNKQDIKLAKGSATIKAELEREVNLLRDSHLKSLSEDDAKSEASTFSFSNGSITFIETSATTKEEQAKFSPSQITAWVKRVVKF